MKAPLKEVLFIPLPNGIPSLYNLKNINGEYSKLLRRISSTQQYLREFSYF